MTHETKKLLDYVFSRFKKNTISIEQPSSFQKCKQPKWKGS